MKRHTTPFLLLAALALAPAPPAAAETGPHTVWTTSLQTGMADTFQLSLGGVFGNGPAWQSSVTTGLGNVCRAGDSASVYGWATLDARNHSHNWQSGLAYRLPVWKRHNHLLSVGSGVQRWLLPSVKSGGDDWLVPGTLSYQTGWGRFSFLLPAIRGRC